MISPAFTTIFLLFLTMTSTLASSMQTPNPLTYPTTVIAGIAIIDTPLVNLAKSYARAHSDDMTYNHVIRSWLLGALIAHKQQQNSPPSAPKVDPELHAVAAILHDLGWDPTGALVSPDKRFEVDGAIAAREWVLKEQRNGTTSGWDDRKTQLLWDSIALHTTPSIAAYKESVVAAVGAGIAADFQGPKSDPTGLLTWEEFDEVRRAFPRLELAKGIRGIIAHVVETKPGTTYDNWMQGYGTRFVKNYSADGKLAVDMIEGSLGDL